MVAELGAALAHLGADVTVLSSSFAGPGLEEVAGVRWVRLRRRYDDVTGAEVDFGRRVLPRLLRGRFDVVHSFGRHDGSASVRAARLHPGRRTVHTDIGIPSRAWWDAHGPREARAVERVVRGVDLYGCLSSHALHELRHEYGREGVLTPGGVDLDRFVPGRRSALPTILFSGALDAPHKGLPTLLEALPLVARIEPDVRLVLSGPGDPAPFLAAAPAGAAARTDVVGVGALDDQPARYASAWCCALPSVGDSFGLVVAESLACGTPAVVADHAAPAELVTPGVTGAVCRPDDPVGLADALVAALRLARRPDTAGRCRASVERFDWRRSVAPALLDLYRQPVRPSGR